jgi:O-antigen/teichoic acid export membrane protein
VRHEIFSLARWPAFIFCCRITGAVAVYFTQILLARWMGPSQLGIYVYAFSCCILLSTLANLGYPSTAVRFIGHSLATGDRNLMRGFIQRGNLIGAASSLLVAGIGTAIIFGTEGLIPRDQALPLFFAMLSIPAYALLSFHSAVAAAFSWFAVAFLPNAVLRPLIFLFLICMVGWAGEPLSAGRSMLFQMVIIFVIGFAQLFVVTRTLKQHVSGIAPSYQTRLWTRTAAPLLVIRLFTNYVLELNVIIVGVHLLAEEVGIFNASFRTAFLIAFGIQAVDAVTLPRAARLYAVRDRETLQNLITRATQLKFCGALCAVLGLIVVGKPILALFGEGFIEGYQALIILAFAQLVLAASGPVAELLSVSGYQDRCLYVSVCALVATVALQGLLAAQLGINGAASTVLLVMVMWTTWLHILVIRRLGIYPSVFTFAGAFH